MTQDERDIDFELLFQAKKNESLLLIDGGICHYHFRRDGQCTIRVLISTKPGSGSKLFATVLRRAKEKNMSSIVAACPADLESNNWYRKKGFNLFSTKTSKTGRALNVWLFPLATNIGFNL